MSRLLRLPGGLRNRIYEDVFTGERIPPKSKPQHCISLLFVCRQIHAETALLPYRYFTFSFEAIEQSPLSTITLRDFIRDREAAQLKAIENLELVTWKAREMWTEGKSLRAHHLSVLIEAPCLKVLKIVIIWGDGGYRLSRATARTHRALRLEALRTDIHANSPAVEAQYHARSSAIGLGISRC
jgi:hypothetical protein